MKCPVGQISNKSEKSDKKKLKDLNKFERFLRRAKRVELDYSDDSWTQKIDDPPQGDDINKRSLTY